MQSPATDKEQVDELLYYARLQQETGIQPNPELACREWVRKYAKRWRELKDGNPVNGIPPNPNYLEVLRGEYLMNEDQYKWGSGRHRRCQTSFHSSFGTSKSFGGVLAEVLRP